MISTSQITFGSTVSFDLYPATIIAANIKNAKVLSILDANTAMRLGFDAPAWHAAVFPTLPPGTPNGHDKYQYLHLRSATGTETFVGLPWIREATYVEESVRPIAIYLQSVSPDEQTRAIQALSAVGLTVSKVELL